MYTDLLHNDSLTARRTPYRPCLVAVFSGPEQKTRYPAARNVVVPDLRVSCRPMKSQPSCRPFASTRSSRPYPFFPFTARVRTFVVCRYRHKCLLLSLTSLTCCFLCQPTRGSSPPPFFSSSLVECVCLIFRSYRCSTPLAKACEPAISERLPILLYVSLLDFLPSIASLPDLIYFLSSPFWMYV